MNECWLTAPVVNSHVSHTHDRPPEKLGSVAVAEHTTAPVVTTTLPVYVGFVTVAVLVAVEGPIVTAAEPLYVGLVNVADAEHVAGPQVTAADAMNMSCV